MKKNKFNIHLQWFSDSPPETVLVDPPGVESTGGVPNVGGKFSTLAPLEVEILEEGLEETETTPPPETGPSREEILKKLDETNRELESVKSNANLAASFEKLADKITPPASAQQQQPSQEEIAAMRKQIDKGLYDKGYTATTDEYIGKTVIPYINKLMSTSLADRKELAKLKYPEWFQKYEGEIDTEVAKIPEQQRLTDPDVFKKAAQKVRAEHLEEIIDEQTQAKIDSAVAEALKHYGIDGTKKQAPTSTVGYSQVGVNSPPKAKPRMGLTPKEIEMAEKKGITKETAYRLKYNVWD